MSAIGSLSIIDLSTVTGGASAPSFNDYTKDQRAKVAGAYRQVVCTTAGIKGGPELAKGVYGAGASGSDQIRAAEMLSKYCQSGTGLPTQAPKSPF